MSSEKRFTLTADHIIWTVLVALYFPLLKELYSQKWENIDYTHAYLILPVSLFLAWRKRKQISVALASGVASAQVVRWGQALLVLGLFLFVFGWRLGYTMVSTLSVFPVLFGMILYRYNTQVARILSFPILYLLLLVPPPLGILDAVTMPMRKGVTSAVAGFLSLFYTVQREGLMLTIGHAQVYVGAPCSGFRSLVSIFALALVYVYLIKMERIPKLILLAAVIPLALLGNFIRVISLCLVTYYFGKEAGEGPFHGISGMVVFLVLIMGMLWLGKLLSGDEGVDD
ncbi:MAG: exosortase/archaeosortase family protein [Candidatus Omnitrophica bacterium]|nr:exosortase/archaeosortase family protein [Candidatus Omnitrophota bacterium]